MSGGINSKALDVMKGLEVGKMVTFKSGTGSVEVARQEGSAVVKASTKNVEGGDLKQYQAKVTLPGSGGSDSAASAPPDLGGMGAMGNAGSAAMDAAPVPEADTMSAATGDTAAGSTAPPTAAQLPALPAGAGGDAELTADAGGTSGQPTVLPALPAGVVANASPTGASPETSPVAPAGADPAAAPSDSAGGAEGELTEVSGGSGNALEGETAQKATDFLKEAVDKNVDSGNIQGNPPKTET
jgi:hypothetical protein